ncbi:hypothetical protein SEA_WHITNEY_54 [Gordonia phage Whitney]|nr:hypothetical protein SEA_WHITNEY_54 [Gordonia phage Whitney]
MSAAEGRTLGPFPVDDVTLDALEHALGTSVEGMTFPDFDNPTVETERHLVGGDYTLNDLLDFLSGHDPERSTLVGYAGDVPIFEGWDQRYSEHDVIHALIAEVRRLRASEAS